MLGKRHPAALGRPARDAWEDIWSVVGPQADAVMSRGEATWNERVKLVMERKGYWEDTYFTWSYSPIRDRAGHVHGLFCAVTEETERVRAEAERDRLAAQRQLALDAAHMGWWHYDPLTKVATYDARYAEIFGVEGNERPNDEILRRLHPDDLPGVWAKVEAALNPSQPQPYSAEYRVVRDDGSVRWVEAHGAAAFAGEGASCRATSFVGTIADITQRKQAEQALLESDERARLLVEAARQLGSSLDPDAIYARLRETIRGAMPLGGLVVSSYDAADGMIRCAYAWLSGNVLDPATLPPLRFKPEAGGGMQSQVIRTGKPLLFNDVVERARDPRGTYVEVNPDGTTRPLGRSAPPANVRSAIMAPVLSEGAVVGVVQVMSNSELAYTNRDLALLEGITFQLGAALENARLYRRAHDEIEERKRVELRLREAVEAAEAASRAKGDFLATLSHELRTPLTPVLLTVSLIESHPALPEEVREDVATIRRNVELESQLISDLLDLTRIERGKLQLDLHDVDLHLILRSAIDICQREASAKLNVELGAARHTVRGDSTRLQQVFWNLINNAIKFTPPHGTITVRTGNNDDARVRVEVIDTGAGIDPSVLPKLFSAFEQGEVRAARQQAGLGLGLAISKKLTEAHGGTIAVASDGRGRGSTFSVELPVIDSPLNAAPVAPQPAVRARGAGAAAAALNVLLVEDHEPTLRVLERLLRQIGHRVTGTTSVASALAAAARDAFDLIISDLGLPDGSGLDVIRRLRDGAAARRAIALTGYGMDADVAASRAAGFAEHLTKPVDLAQLEAAIDRTMRAVKSAGQTT
jgi:PAS domain S-box-containing protein